MTRPTDDELERRSLHAAEIEMDRLLADEEAASRGEPDATVNYDLSSPVHAGRLAAAIHTLRLLSGSVGRLRGKAADLEAAAGRHLARLEVLEAVVLLLLTGFALVIAGVQASATAAAILALYLWWIR